MSTTDTPILIPSGSVLEIAFGTEVRGQVMKHVDACFDAANAASRKFEDLVKEAKAAEMLAARLFHCAYAEMQSALALGILRDSDLWYGKLSPSQRPANTVTLGEKLDAARCPESVKPQAHLVLPPAHTPIEMAAKEPEPASIFNLTVNVSDALGQAKDFGAKLAAMIKDAEQSGVKR